ncbi:MAG: sodium:solute symporter family protein [Agarilytica sp.]
MGPEIFKYGLLIAFIGLTFWLSWVGMQKAKSIKGFAIGNKDMSPILVGVTMASSVASTATFVINPGFVFQWGLSAYMHFTAASLGFLAAIILLTKKFRRSGGEMGSITIPGWIYDRYGSRAMSLFFAFANLATVTFVVLILVGSSILLSTQFPISQKAALVLCLFFVFSYVLMGGVYAHAYTNAFQGVMMLIIAVFLFFHGLKYFDGDFFGSLKGVSEHYASVYNPESGLYMGLFSTFISGFMITFALMMQPHILSKVLYLRDDKQVNKFVWTTVIVGTAYTLILFVGFYAKLSGVQVPRQDMVVPVYLATEFASGTFGPYISAFITVTLLAAGLSTLDGILVALSAMTVNDIYKPFAKTTSPQEYARHGLMLSRLILIVLGLIALAIAWNPPKLVGIFAQKGVYSLAAASLVPILFGVLGPKNVPTFVVFGSALIGFFGHLYLNIFGGIYNPAVSSSYAMLAGIAFYVVCVIGLHFKKPTAASEVVVPEAEQG